MNEVICLQSNKAKIRLEKGVETIGETNAHNIGSAVWGLVTVKKYIGGRRTTVLETDHLPPFLMDVFATADK